MVYGTAWKKERTTELVISAVLDGFRGIDTACQPKHYREDLVGRAIEELISKKIVSRDELWIQTKFTPLSGQDPKNIPYDASAPLPQQVAESLERSLANLRVDRIDSLLLHSPMDTLDQTLVVWRQFEIAVDAGKVAGLGISNCYDPSFLDKLFEKVRIKPQVVQNRFYKDSGYDKQIRAFCLQHGIVYQSFWTLTANPRLLKSPALLSIALRDKITPEQVLYRFVVELGAQPLTGTTSAKHRIEAAAVASLRLSKADVLSLNSLL